MLILIISGLWVFLGLRAIEAGEVSWATGNLEGLSWAEQYVRANYWTVTTLTTVGYGDFLPASDSEFLFTMAVEFLGIAFFSMVMGSINTVLV